MRNVLADLALEAEAAMALAMRLARAYDAGEGSREALFRRIVTPAAKFWICKRGPALAAEAMEVLGGNGYVEEGPLARVYRQMPLNSIWEGAGNIVCLDVLRAMRREPECVEALFDELAAARGGNPALDVFVDRLHGAVRGADEAQARMLAQHVALALQGALLVRFAPSFVADAFCASRLAREHFAGGAFGLLPASAATTDIIDRALPA
jgi:putative acyl-CoA dehydrogenase